MKIILVADSHGDVSLLRDRIHQFPDAQMIIHLGDHDSDAGLISEFSHLQILTVKGNNDYGSRSNLDGLIHIEGHTLFFTHGHKYGVYSGTQKLYYKALEVGADLVFYGHTHFYDYESYGDVTIINPGSLSLSRDGNNSFVVLDISEDEVNVERII